MNKTKLLTLFKRELWEHKNSFFGLFIAMGATFLFFCVVFIIKISASHDMSENMISGVDFSSVKKIAPFLHAVILVIFYTFISTSVMVTMNYLLGSLYDDRRDRSILFWKSMPVSETHNVLIKFVTGLLIVPIISLVIGFITTLLLSLIIIIFGFVFGLGNFSFILLNMGLASGLLSSTLFIVVSGIWIAPIYSWLMLVSATTSSSPLMWSVLPPAGIILLEKVFIGESRLFNVFASYFPDFRVHMANNFSNAHEFLNGLIKSFLMGPEIFVGVIISVGLLFVAIWMRNNRYEI